MDKIVKYSRPTVYDKAPFGRIWVAELETTKEQYIQLSKDENVGHWSKLGDFLEDSYLDEHLKLYLDKLKD